MRQRHLRKTNTRLQFHVYEAKRRLLSTARPFQRLTFAKVSSFELSYCGQRSCGCLNLGRAEPAPLINIETVFFCTAAVFAHVERR